MVRKSSCDRRSPRRRRSNQSSCCDDSDPCDGDGFPGKHAKHCESVESFVGDITKTGKDIVNDTRSTLRCLIFYWRCGEYFAILCTLLPYLGLLALFFYLWTYKCYIGQYLGPFRKIFGQFFPSCWLKSTDQRIHEAIDRYHADQIGIPDYALESTGGSVLCSSDTYFSKSGPLYSLFGIPIWYSASTPREVIKPDVHPGRCWAMDGDKGYVTIQLRMPVVAGSVSLEHIPRAVAPTEADQNTALKDFQITGREHDLTSPEIMLGNFTYQKKGKPLQQFKLRDSACATSRFPGNWCGPNKQTVRIVTLKIFSNHGNSNFTCIYRFRVHAHHNEDEC